jgi:WD40 repeat protein
MDSKYTAFISYRHIPLDITVAKAIHYKLETYKIPVAIRKQTGIKKMGRCFRDQDELPTSSDLMQDILNSLKASDWLIVICTPDLPKSKWCVAEIEEFIKMHGRSRVLAVLAAGEPSESFPDILRFETSPTGEVVECEPLACDLRDEGQVPSKRVIMRKLKTEKLRLIAPMLGVRYDDLRRRARERFLKRVALIATLAAMFSVVFGGYTLNRAIVIAQQRNDALISQSKFLSWLAEETLESGDPTTAALLALAALPQDLANPERPLVEAAVTALRNAGISRVQEGYTLTGGVQTDYGNGWQYLEQAQVLTVPDSAGRWNYYHMPSGRLLGKTAQFAAYSPERSLIAVLNSSVTEIYSLENLSEPIRTIEASKEIVRINYYIYFCPNGQYLIRSYGVGSVGNNYIELICLDTGEVIYTITNDMLEAGGIQSAGISPDGRYLAVSLNGVRGGLPRLYLFELLTGEKAVEMHESTDSIEPASLYSVNNIIFSPDGNLICVLDYNDHYRIFSTVTGELLHRINVTGDDFISFANALFSPDGRYLAVLTKNKAVLIYDTADWSEISSSDPAAGRINYIGFTEENTLVFHRGETSVGINFLELDSGRLYTVQIPELSFGSLLVMAGIQTGSNSFAAFSERGVFQLWQRDAYLDVEMFDYASNSNDTAKAYSPDAKRFAVSINAVLKVFDADSLQLTAQSEFVGSSLTTQIIWSPDGRQILTADYGGTIRLYDADTCDIINVWESAYTNSRIPTVLVAAPDWSKFVINNTSHIGGMYDLQTFEKLTTDIEISLSTHYVYSPDGLTFYILFSKMLLIYDMRTGEQINRLRSVEAGYGLATSPDGRKIAFGGSDDSRDFLFVFDSQGEQELWRGEKTIDINGCVVFSPDGLKIAAVNNLIGRTVIFNAETGQIIRELNGTTPSFSPCSDYILLHNQPTIRMALTADVITANLGNGVIFSIETGEIFANLPAPGVFSPAGDAVLMQDAVWQIKPLEQLINQARYRLYERELTGDERRRYFLD